MKSIYLASFLLVSSVSFAQVNFDHKAERAKVEKEMSTKGDQLQELYKILYDNNGQEIPAIRSKIDKLQKELEVLSPKMSYLYSIGFDKIEKEYSESKKLKHFKAASNRYAAVTVKDSKGQIISHDSLDDLINEVYDRDISKKYGCYADDLNPADDVSQPFEEGQTKYIAKFMKELGYKDYDDLKTQNYKTFCAIEEAHDDNAQIPECGDFLSGVRISLLETVEKKVKAKRDGITKVGYFKAKDEQFLEYDAVKDVQYEIEEQIKNIEALCLDKKLKNNMEIFNYLESEVEKDGISIEYTNFNFQSSKVNKQ
jgi:hypothetical protein